MERNARAGLALIAIGLVMSVGLGYYFGAITARPEARGAAASSPFVLNLVETMANNFNSSSPAQAKFLVVTQDGLQSSANITIPAGALVELVITSYDMGSAPPNPQYDAVTGTVNNQLTVVNGTVASGDNVSQEYQRTYTNVPNGMILHTFTVPQLHLNIPVVAGATEIAYFRANATGTFEWYCMTPCGTGANGLGGAMQAAGWMTGQLTVA